MTKLVECVPNFSEGRRLAVVEKIVAAIVAVREVQLLDFSLDADHNRSVVTFVAPPETVAEAAFAGIARAAELINMDEHRGQHPRIGATDVCPFVPIEDITLLDCAKIARRLGRRVGEELRLPVYLYEAAAFRSERRNLANVRRGQYEILKLRIDRDPQYEPDFGPAEMGSAGAIAIGAREALIAFNVYLNTDDIQIARHIASAIRQSNGGLSHVKALGLLVKGRAQVSLNLVDYKRTPLHTVMESIRREAKHYNVQITGSELIGLIPQQAMLDIATWYLQLDDFDARRVLENRIRH